MYTAVTNGNTDTGSASGKRLRWIAIRFGAVLLSAITALLIAELMFRAYVAIAVDAHDYSDVPSYTQPMPHSKRVFGLKPHLGPPFNTNSLGFRGAEVSPQKPLNTYRIIMLGDSITYGTGIPWNQTFSHVLQQNLNAQSRKTRFEVLNLGMSSYNTSQELAFLQEVGLQFSPDAIVLNICLNDSDPPLQLSKAGPKHATAITGLSDLNLRTIVGSSYILTVIKTKFVNLMQNNHNLLDTLNSPTYLINARIHENAWGAMKDDMNKILDITREHEIPLAVVIYPYSSQIGLDEQEREPQRDLVRFWNERHVPVLDAVPVYQDATQTMFEDGVVHLSTYGHQRIASVIQEFLHDSKLLPPLQSESPVPK